MTTTTTKAAKAATPKTPAKVSHAKAKAPELPNISSVKLVPLALIDVLPQVRTMFDDESIAELAADIQARGLLQPVLLNPHGTRFTLIAGERRLRACRLAELSDIPALITKASSADALLMQLAENIQREDLDLGDQVRAIRNLHDHQQSVAAIAETVKKSSAWVSKRLALSHDDLHCDARRLMEDGITEDVEILNGIGTLYNIGYHHGARAAADVRTGKATRESIRQAVKDAKADLRNEDGPAPDPEAQARRAAERQAKNIARHEACEAWQRLATEGTGPEFLDRALGKISNECTAPGDHVNGGTAYLNTLREDQRAAILAHLQQLQDLATTWNFTELALAFTPWDCDYNYVEQFAIVLAMKNQAVDLYAMIAIMKAANLPEDETA